MFTLIWIWIEYQTLYSEWPYTHILPS